MTVLEIIGAILTGYFALAGIAALVMLWLAKNAPRW